MAFVIDAQMTDYYGISIFMPSTKIETISKVAQQKYTILDYDKLHKLLEKEDRFSFLSTESVNSYFSNVIDILLCKCKCVLKYYIFN